MMQKKLKIETIDIEGLTGIDDRCSRDLNKNF